jgi:hypothetical protein
MAGKPGYSPPSAMYPHSFLWHYLWIAPRALQVIIAVVMVRRRLFREFPVFFIYTIFQVLEQGTLFFLDHSAAVSDYQYWYAHWFMSTVSIGLRFGILWEIFSNVFRNYSGIRSLNRVLFRSAIVVLLLLATIVAARVPEDGTFRIFSMVHVLDLSVDVMQTGLWLLLLGLCSYFRLSLRSFPYGIAFGLGIFSTVDLATEVSRAWTGFVAGYAYDFVTMATYHCCAIIWLVYLLAPERSVQTLQELPENNLEQWNAELQRLLLQ